MKRIIFVALACVGMAGATAASTVPSCSSLNASTSYSTFTSCTSFGATSGQDFFSNVSAIVNALFSDEGIVITEAGSYSPGPGTGGEFFGDNAMAGFDVDGTSNPFTFVSLPANTIFVTIKQGGGPSGGFELFGVPASGLPFIVSHSLVGNGFSHFSTFAGTVPTPPPPPPTNPIPLPAAGWMLLAGVGGLAAWGRRRSS